MFENQSVVARAERDTSGKAFLNHDQPRKLRAEPCLKVEAVALWIEAAHSVQTVAHHSEAKIGEPIEIAKTGRFESKINAQLVTGIPLPVE